jgi:chemotaxis protein CheC
MMDWDIFEMDVYREIGAIAAGYGTEALTKLLNQNIKVHLPEVLPVSNQEAMANNKGHQVETISVECDILSGLSGKLILTFDETSAEKFINLCYPGYELADKNGFNELGMSALKEVGNIVLSSYVGALSSFINIPVVPSPPVIIAGTLADIIKKAIDNQEKVYVLLVEAVFEKEQEEIRGRIEFLLTPSDKDLIRNSMNKPPVK